MGDGASATSQQVQSASVCVNTAPSLNSDQGTVQSSRTAHKLSDCCQSKKNCGQLCVHILNRHKNPALRHKTYFNITTAPSQRLHEGMDVPIQINEICCSGTGLCSYRTARGIKVADDSPPKPIEANRGMQIRKLNQEL